MSRVMTLDLDLYLQGHSALIWPAHLVPIPKAIFNARAFKFDTNVVGNVTFDQNSEICWIHGFVIVPTAQLVDLFRIPDTIFNPRIFKFDTNVVCYVTFDISSGFS